MNILHLLHDALLGYLVRMGLILLCRDEPAALNGGQGRAAAGNASAPVPRRSGRRSTHMLTPLQERFVFEYLKDFNATRAYMRARPCVSKATADACARRMLGNARISKAIAAEREVLASRMALEAEQVLRETARIAFFDFRRLFDADGRPLPVSCWDDNTAAAVVGLEVFEQFEGSGSGRRLVGRVWRYKLADKNAALDRAAKFLGLYERDHRQRSDPLRDLLDGMRRSAVPVAVTPPTSSDATED